jgi:hypothetical protein
MAITVIVAIIFVGTAIFFWAAAQKRVAAELNALPFRNLKRSNRPGHINEANVGGRLFFHEYTLSPKNRAPEDLVISTEVNTHTHLKIVGGKKLKSFTTSFGLSKSYETGDSEFDETFFVTCNNPRIQNDVLGDAGIRMAVKKAMIAESSRITLIDGLLKFSIPISHFREIKALENGELIYQALAKIADVLPAELSYLRPISVGPIYSGRDVAQILPLILIALSALAWQFLAPVYEPVDFNFILLSSFSFSVPISGAYLWFSLKNIKKTLAFRREFLVAVITAITAIPLIILSIIIFMNGFLDQDLGEQKKGLIVKKEMTGRSYDKFKITVIFEDFDNLKKSVYISQENFLKVEPMVSHIVFRQRQGFLGYPWISNIALEEQDKNESF